VVDSTNGTDAGEAPVILTPTKIDQTITRIAYEITEKNQNLNDFVILGILTRGAVFAQRLSNELKKIHGVKIPCGSLDTSLYRDDYQIKGPVLNTQGSQIDFAIDGKTVLLADDVLFTGRSVAAAIRHIFDLGRPERIQLAVLIDRGHRELPLRPDYCGKNVPTQYVEKIRVRFAESDGQDIVVSGVDGALPDRIERK